MSHFRYSISSGVFTVPPGGAGLYFFSVDLQYADWESGQFRLVGGGTTYCDMKGDNNGSGNNIDTGGCTAVMSLSEGMC